MVENKFIPPRYGEPIPLVCIKCKHRFVGPNPRGSTLFEDIFSKRKKTQCPACGSKKVIPDPFIHW